MMYKGLTESQVAESRAKYGINVLTPPAKEPLWRKFLSKFSDPLIIILLVAGVLSIGISIYEYIGLDKPISVFFEPVGIFMAIILATGLAFIFELQAEREFAILNQVNDDEPVKVIRSGNTIQIPRRDVVVGDIVILATGDEIPADGELLESVTLHVDESTLTGEPICSKTTQESEFDKNATYPSNNVLRGTKVMEGHAVYEVKAVGDATENGKVFVEAQIDQSVKTPLNIQLEKLSKIITLASYTIAALIFVGRVIMYAIAQTEGLGWDLVDFVTYLLQTVMIVVALIVVAVPEGLPMAVTLSLAYSMKSMLKTNNLVRKMHACETMGATTVICTDKTGTLTQNRMTVREAYFFAPSGEILKNLSRDVYSSLIAESIAINSSASLDFSSATPTPVGNPTEGALLLWLDSANYDYRALQAKVRRISETPFSTERKYMESTVYSDVLGGEVSYVKGAPEVVLSMCDGNRDAEITKVLADYQQQAMRTLGFAYKEAGDAVYTFMGVVAIADPIRLDVPDAIKKCQDAGIQIKVVTGDTINTAREIAKQIGLWSEEDGESSIIIGPKFAEMTDVELLDKVEDIKIIARARPLDKKRLVEALQAKGHVVAVTGDGTNDAPALKSAHVGLSMGDGTSVAKEASDITIIDNSFASIGRAVMWGRSLYQNIQRFILFQMTVNVAACMVVLVGAFLGTESPLSVTQMLWVNLIMDTFAAMALASLPPSEVVMKDKPRDRKAFIISRPMAWNIVVYGMIFFGLLTGLWMFFHYSDINYETKIAEIFNSRDTAKPVLDAYECSLFFTIFVMLQFWNLFNARAFQTKRSAFHFKDCKGFLTIVALIFFGQIGIVTFGGELFNVEPLNPIHWIVIILGTMPVLLVGELVRLVRK
ncbi:MAG: calcium-translocating P-type ATPase, PMCA-type [Bacteroidales bacterium]|nr:calcium-translocating P-type ATPase, PMCA-type [Bacteroidales bacterium]